MNSQLKISKSQKGRLLQASKRFEEIQAKLKPFSSSKIIEIKSTAGKWNITSLIMDFGKSKK